MGYRIQDAGFRKITATVVCEFDDECREFESGAILAETSFDKPYEVAEIKVLGNKIVVILNPAEDHAVNGPVNWSGETAVSQYDRDEKWVKAHVEQFGEEATFF